MTKSIYITGSDSPLSQVEAFKRGVTGNKDLDFSLTSDILSADAIFINNPPYDEVLNLKKSGKLKDGCIVVCNILDIATHLLDKNVGYSPFTDYSRAINEADLITCISHHVQLQIVRYFPKCTPFVIRTPCKNVKNNRLNNGESKPFPEYRAMLVGRQRDPNKRAELAINALFIAGFKPSEVAVVGPEPLSWGVNFGLVSDEVLSDLYNSVDYVMATSLMEGLCLPIVEGAICGAIPIVCHDLTTADDLGIPKLWRCFPSHFDIANWIMRLEKDSDFKRIILDQVEYLGETYQENYNCYAVAENLTRLIEIELKIRSAKRALGVK